MENETDTNCNKSKPDHITDGIMTGIVNGTSSIVKIHVSGNTYELDLDDVRRAPESTLYRYIFVGKKMSLTFKRPIQSFEAVLAYYQTGELHMPTSVCPGAFKTELKYWGLDPQILSKCCYYRYLSHQEDQETLDRFHLHLFPDVGKPKEQRKILSGLRSKLWNVLDNLDSSIPTKIYFCICMLMVILSVLTLALSTLPYFRRVLTGCEYELATGKVLQSVNSNINLNDSCNQPIADEWLGELFTDYELATEEVPESISTTKGSAFLPGLMQPTVSPGIKQMFNETTFADGRSFLFNLESPAVEDKELLSHMVDTLRPKVGIQKKTVRINLLVYLDVCILAFFTFDIVMRLLCCPSIPKYFLSTVNIIDALVVLAAYANYIVNTLNEKEKYELTGLDLLEIFQVLRVVRLIRVVRNVTGFKVLTFSMKVSLQELFVLFLYLLLGVVIFANFIFFVEHEADFASIPDGWWWAINTLTTVGYGDITPKTLYGRLIGALCAIFGVVMMAVAIPVFVKTFMLLYGYAVLYKNSISKPEDTHMYIHRQGIKMGQIVEEHNEEKSHVENNI